MSCPRGKLINPVTGNCVEKTSSTGRAIVRDTCYAIGLDYNKKKVACESERVVWPFSLIYEPQVTSWWWFPSVPINPSSTKSPLVLPIEATWLANGPFMQDEYVNALGMTDSAMLKRFLFVFREIVARLLCNAYSVANARGGDLFTKDTALLEDFGVYKARIALVGSSLKDIIEEIKKGSKATALYSVFVWTVQQVEQITRQDRHSFLPEALVVKEEGQSTAVISYSLDSRSVFSARVPMFPMVAKSGVPLTHVYNYMCDKTLGTETETFILQHETQFICVQPKDLLTQLEQAMIQPVFQVPTVSFEVESGHKVTIAIELFDLQRFFYFLSFRGTAISIRLYFYFLYAPILLSLDTSDVLSYHPLQKQCHYQFESSLKKASTLEDRLRLFVQSMMDIEQRIGGFYRTNRSVQGWSDACSQGQL